jgi:hypothetical protein
VGVEAHGHGAGYAVPSGTRFLFLLLTPDLRPGLTYAAPPGLERVRAFCALRPLSVCDVPQGLKPASICEPYAALKRRSFTLLRAVVVTAEGKGLKPNFFRGPLSQRSKRCTTQNQRRRAGGVEATAKSKATDRSVRSTRVGMASGEEQIPRSSSPLRGCERTRNDKGFFLSSVGM